MEWGWGPINYVGGRIIHLDVGVNLTTMSNTPILASATESERSKPLISKSSTGHEPDTDLFIHLVSQNLLP